VLKIEMMNACVAERGGVDMGWNLGANCDSFRVIRKLYAVGLRRVMFEDFELIECPSPQFIYLHCCCEAFQYHHAEGDPS